MCMVDPDALTLTGLLQDPLTRMVMRSDGVTETDFSNLMLRVKDCLVARQDAADAGQRHRPAGLNPDCRAAAVHFPRHAIYQL